MQKSKQQKVFPVVAVAAKEEEESEEEYEDDENDDYNEDEYSNDDNEEEEEMIIHKKITPEPKKVKLNNNSNDSVNIGKFHVLQKKLAQVDTNPEYKNKEALKIKMKADIQRQIKLLGGLEQYQKQSLIGEENNSFDSSFYVLKILNELILSKELIIGNNETEKDSKNKFEENKRKKLSLLDVGAIKNHYPNDDDRLKLLKDVLQVTSIDLNASLDQSNKVIKADFFEFVKGKRFDIVVLSLVINFVGDVRKRGKMLKLCENVVRLNGYLFIVLPSACLNNSRYLNTEIFQEMLNSCGFIIIQTKETAKLNFFVCKRTNDDKLRSPPKDFNRSVIRPGTHK